MAGCVSWATWTSLSRAGWRGPLPLHSTLSRKPLDFRVKVTGCRRALLRDLQGGNQLKKSQAWTGLKQCRWQKTGGYYTGSYTGVDRAGTYKLELRLATGQPVGELLCTQAGRKAAAGTLYRFPHRKWLPPGRGCCLFRLPPAGRQPPVQAGRDLKVEIFQLVLSYEDSSKVTVSPLLTTAQPG